MPRRHWPPLVAVTRTRPLPDSLPRAIDGSVRVAAVGHRGIAPVLAARPPVKPATGPVADVAATVAAGPPVSGSG